MTSIGGIDLIGGTVAAFGALLTYDVFFITFAEEISLVWRQTWSFGKILYLLNRYLPFFDTFLSLHLLLGRNTDEECLRGFKAVTWLIVIGIIISELILMVRTYALWERDRIVLYLLLFLASAAIVPAFVVTQLEIDSFAYKSVGIGCTKTKNSSPIIFIAFLMLILCETGMEQRSREDFGDHFKVITLAIVTLTVIRVWRHHRNSKSAVLVRMYKDGLLYYLYLLAFSIVNVIIALAAPPQYANWLTTPQRVVHSLLGARVVLHIRSHQDRPDSFITEVDDRLTFGPRSEFQNDSSSASTELTSFHTKPRSPRDYGRGRTFKPAESTVSHTFSSVEFRHSLTPSNIDQLSFVQ
ncbi:hypothetical protein SCHPADRAFT_197154 [Schizopora paradoxa]|uniref:DUF6533 domain-containing protein n=1 Tax=Schizopora paradoxa TaxID=27342 RepID=A0A0H2RYP9_9AGAM|nr:hypothetical protein SCHPADRAFT_197154 [Schizopora paradoxa]